MSLEDDIAFLRAGADARGARPQALRILAIGAETRKLPSGAVLFYAGDLADGGYVVQEGSLLLEPAPAGRRRRSRSGPARCSASSR